jgi:hypothetical protein
MRVFFLIVDSHISLQRQREAVEMNNWTKRMFAAKQVKKGGIIRRKRANIDKWSSLDAVVKHAQKEGWHVLETGGQIVVLCHKGHLVVHC